MNPKGTMFRFPTFILFFIFLILIACSTPSWFPFKKGPPHKAKMKDLVDKEVVIIDKREYVKVSNPRASEGSGQPKILYIPVDEYLSEKQSFAPLKVAQEPARKASPGSSMAAAPPADKEKEVFVTSSPSIPAISLKKKVLVTYFDDQAGPDEEALGDWMAERLIKEVNRKSQRILFVDYPMVKEFLGQRGIPLTDLEKPKVLGLLNEVFGVHALVVGYLAGPYVFLTKAPKDPEGTASAIIKFEMKVVDTLSGKTLKTLTATNPTLASQERGSFSKEKAKMKAIDLALADLSGSLSKALDDLDWFCRVAKVEDNEVYINAGKLTGLKVGDVMDVFHLGEPPLKEENKGKIRISGYFGVDASTGRVIDGNQPDVNDILRLAKGKSKGI